jgi:hypothetical protein
MNELAEPVDLDALEASIDVRLRTDPIGDEPAIRADLGGSFAEFATHVASEHPDYGH